MAVCKMKAHIYKYLKNIPLKRATHLSGSPRSEANKLLPGRTTLILDRYQLSVDGTVAAYRLPYLMAGNSLVLKQDSGYYEHFYKEMKPWVHYVPVRADLSDLEEKIEWARANDEKVSCFHH